MKARFDRKSKLLSRQKNKHKQQRKSMNCLQESYSAHIVLVAQTRRGRVPTNTNFRSHLLDIFIIIVGLAFKMINISFYFHIFTLLLRSVCVKGYRGQNVGFDTRASQQDSSFSRIT